MGTLNSVERESYVKKLMESGSRPGANENGGVETSAVVRRYFVGSELSGADAKEIAEVWIDRYAAENPAYKITTEECAEIAAATDWLGDGMEGNHIEVYRGGVTGKIRVYDLTGCGSTIKTDDPYLGYFSSKYSKNGVARRLHDEYGCKVPKHLIE